MKVVLSGATGFIGSSILRELCDSGHEVIAPVRSEASAEKATAGGARAVVGDLTDTAWLAGLLRDADGFIHTATTHEGSPSDFDNAVVSAVIEAFSGTEKPYVHSGGAWSWGTGDAITEDDPLNPPAIVAWRGPIEGRVLESGVKASIVAPAIVYGNGRGIPVLAIAQGLRNDDGALQLIGDGSQHWTTVHVDDIARLYVLVLMTASGGERYIGASGVNPTVREMAEAVVGPEGTVLPSTIEETNARLGEAFAEALLNSQQADGAKAKALGWTPVEATALEELAALDTRDAGDGTLMSQPHQTPIQQMMGNFAPTFAALTDDVLFGQVWSRPELSPRDRSLVTISSLVSAGNIEQLRSHIPTGIANGLTKKEVVEAITHVAFYAGWPKAVSSLMLAQELLTAEEGNA